MGPPWAYWAFPMERFCGKIMRCIKSRRHPFANIDSHITAIAQLDQIKNRYNAHEQLALLPQKVGNSREFAFEECKCFHTCSVSGSPIFLTYRPHFGSVLPTSKKSQHSRGAGLENHCDISYSLQHITYHNQTPFLSSRGRTLGEISSTGRWRHDESGGSLPFECGG
jgi:hypothetical protein